MFIAPQYNLNILYCLPNLEARVTSVTAVGGTPATPRWVSRTSTTPPTRSATLHLTIGRQSM